MGIAVRRSCTRTNDNDMVVHGNLLLEVQTIIKGD